MPKRKREPVITDNYPKKAKDKKQKFKKNALKRVKRNLVAVEQVKSFIMRLLRHCIPVSVSNVTNYFHSKALKSQCQWKNILSFLLNALYVPTL